MVSQKNKKMIWFPLAIMIPIVATLYSVAYGIPEDISDLQGHPSTLCWLAQQQHDNGFWGEGEKRIKLTCLAVMSYFLNEENPGNSSKYNDNLIKALEALAKESKSNTKIEHEENALLTWCFTEAYNRTQNPSMGSCYRRHAKKMDCSKPTIWHLLALQSLRMSPYDSTSESSLISKMQKNCPVQTNNLQNLAMQICLNVCNEKDTTLQYYERIQQIHPAMWKKHPFPLQTALLLDRVLFWKGGKNWKLWDEDLRIDILKRGFVQKNKDQKLNWWTLEGLGINNRSEVEGMTEKQEAIYTTCMIVQIISRPKHYLPPAYRKPFSEGNSAVVIDTDDIRIDPGEL